MSLMAIPQNSHRNFRQQAYATIPTIYLAVFMFPSEVDMNLKPIPVIDCVTFAVLPLMADEAIFSGTAQQIN